MELVPVLPLLEVAYVIAAGSAKRGEANNWRGGVSYAKYYAKIVRHAFAFALGRDRDAESGRYQLAHLIADAMILLDCQIRNVGTDDRHK